ncbi:MAG: DUF6206 family protein [Actinomycetota bacterium]
MQQVQVSDEQLHDVERSYRRALDARSIDGLNVIGYGEIGLAIAIPTDAPRAVVKRMAASPDAAMVSDYAARMDAYQRHLAEHVRIIPTDQRSIVDDQGWTVPYMIQPLIDSTDLCENILAEARPDDEHPVLVALRDVVERVGAITEIGLDSQVSNFAWVDDELVCLDVGSPLVFDAHGEPDIEIGPYQRAMPAVLNPVLRRVLIDLTNRMGNTREGLRHAATSLLRLELDDWLAPALTTFNTVLDEPLEEADIRNGFSGIKREMKVVKSFARVQRAWVTRVRRQPYDFFITDSFTKEIL